jgi:hypothetical protein
MVDLFLSERDGVQDAERRWWGNPKLSIEEACTRAMFALENEAIRDGHQWVFSNADLKAMARRLSGHSAALESATSFETLYRVVERALGLGKNAKPLLVYDVARRLGYRFGLEPNEVYLHAGPKVGASALKRGLGAPRSRPLSDFPTSIQTRLTPAQAEDFLCLAASSLRSDLWD